MGRTGVAVDAAMFAALVGVDGAIEADVGTRITGDDSPSVFRGQGGAERRGRFVLIRPAVVPGLASVGFIPTRGVGTCAASIDRLVHGRMMRNEVEQIKNKLVEEQPGGQAGLS